MELKENIILIVVSGIVLISHFFNVVANKTRIPSVLLLIGFGMTLKGIGNCFNVEIINVNNYLGVLGTIGLILIVLEGAADLKIKKENLAIIRGSFGAALGILILSTAGVAIIFHYSCHESIRNSLVNALPLAVISSAIAIPTITEFVKHKKEFLTYESIFSDILGIMVFNFLIVPSVFNLAAGVHFTFELVVVLIASVAGAFLLLGVLHNIKTPVKFFIILSLLVLIYTVGKIFHLSSLLLVLIFGLLINNLGRFSQIKRLMRITSEEIDADVEQLKLFVAESAFLVRTFFFVIFGYSISLTDACSLEVLKIGIPIMFMLLFIRFIYLKVIVKAHVFPEIFIAPKGLVTILLFYSIPQSMRIASLGEGEVLFVILCSSLLMLASGFSEKHLKTISPTNAI